MLCLIDGCAPAFVESAHTRAHRIYLTNYGNGTLARILVRLILSCLQFFFSSMFVFYLDGNGSIKKKMNTTTVECEKNNDEIIFVLFECAVFEEAQQFRTN